MLRQLPLIAGLMLVGAPAAAATYSATPVSAASGRIIARDIAWTCGPAVCQGATAESRPLVLCEGLAKRAGPIASFVADGRAFTPAELNRCNASAKAQAASAVAAR